MIITIIIIISLIGQTIGSILASVSYAPSGNIKGDGIEEILSRTAYHLNQGQLLEATKELNNVQGIIIYCHNNYYSYHHHHHQVTLVS